MRALGPFVQFRGNQPDERQERQRGYAVAYLSDSRPSRFRLLKKQIVGKNGKHILKNCALG
jgi:hypothetical protein